MNSVSGCPSILFQIRKSVFGFCVNTSSDDIFFNVFKNCTVLHVVERFLQIVYCSKNVFVVNLFCLLFCSLATSLFLPPPQLVPMYIVIVMF